MRAYLVPAGGDRYAPYSEAPSPAPTADHEPPPTTLVGRAVAVFRRALAEGEAARQNPGAAPASTAGRLRHAALRRIAEAVAEQRLLWHLRRESAVELVHPDDLDREAAAGVMRRLLAGDRDRHRRWLVIDALLTVASAPVALLPGPNLLAYYFIFRTVGHFLSMRGAAHGLSAIDWSYAGSAELTRLRGALDLAAAERDARIRAVANALGLHGLDVFVHDVTGR